MRRRRLEGGPEGDKREDRTSLARLSCLKMSSACSRSTWDRREIAKEITDGDHVEIAKEPTGRSVLER